VKPQHYAEVASLILAAEATFAITHRLMGGEYRGYVHEFNVVIDVGLAALWLAAATAAMLHRSSSRAFVLVALATLVSFLHGMMFSIASARGLGLPFVVAAVVLVVALKRSLPAWHLDAVPVAPGHAPVPRGRLSWSGRH
jgi:hypothetical protein